MEQVFASFLHLTCPGCGKNILANFARPQASRTCLQCGRTITVPPKRLGRFGAGEGLSSIQSADSRLPLAKSPTASP